MATPARSLPDASESDAPTEATVFSVSSDRRRPRRPGDGFGGTGLMAVLAALVGTLPLGVPETVVTGLFAVVSAVIGRRGYVGGRENRFQNARENRFPTTIENRFPTTRENRFWDTREKRFPNTGETW